MSGSDDRPLIEITRRLTEERARLAQEFLQHHKVTRYVALHTAVVDRCVGAIADAVLAPMQHTLAVLAVGGYGRRELFPFSDIDLLIVASDTGPAPDEQAIGQLLQHLWDSGLKTSHAVRRVSECVVMAAKDHTIMATLLDRRYLWGAAAVNEALEQACKMLAQESYSRWFVEEKHRERIERYQRYGDSRLYLEPHVKEGKGGLRDLHHVYWLARQVYGAHTLHDMVSRGLWREEDADMFRRAQVFLWRVRMYLHLFSGRAQERMSFELQPRLAAAFGYRADAGQSPNLPTERFMKRYFRTTKAVADLTRLLAALLEEGTLHYPSVGIPRLEARIAGRHEYRLHGSRLAFAADVSLDEAPHLAIEIFWLSQLLCVPIDPAALHQVFRSLTTLIDVLPHDVQANTLFLNIVLHPHYALETLRELNESGVLSCLIPEFGQIIGQMQYDRYHVYTVDEHTLQAVGILHAIERGEPIDELPLACALAVRNSSRRVLYVALLCHDIAKGSGQDHAVEGATRARRIALRLGLSEAETDTVTWLVKQQMLLSDVALKRDLDDAKTIADLVAHIQLPERLRLLLLLTVCDMRAVGPNVWNRWRGALLRSAYYKAEAMMLGKTLSAATSSQASRQAWLAAWQPHADIPDRAVLFERMQAIDDTFWAACPQDQAPQMADLVAQFWRRGETPLCMQWRVDRYEGVTHVMLCASQHPGLLALAAGAVTAISASIIRARLLVLPEATALIMLELQDLRHQAFDDVVRLKKLEQLLRRAVPQAQHELLLPLIAEQRSAYKEQDGVLPPAVSFDNESSHEYTLIEVEGQDCIGFLYALCAGLSALRLTIATAHINTFGSQAVDVFYVRDRFGLKLTSDNVQQRLRQHIIEHFERLASK